MKKISNLGNWAKYTAIGVAAAAGSVIFSGCATMNEGDAAYGALRTGSAALPYNSRFKSKYTLQQQAGILGALDAAADIAGANAERIEQREQLDTIMKQRKRPLTDRERVMRDIEERRRRRQLDESQENPYLHDGTTLKESNDIVREAFRRMNR